jgi:D-alanyl-D-alanine carboxypeptidase
MDSVETQATTILDTTVTTTITTVSQTSESGTTSVSIAEGFDVPAGGKVSSSGITVKSISLDKYSVNISVGESDMPIVTMLPENATDKSEVWESSNTQVATVDSYGNIKGISEGTCTVTVKSKSNTLVHAEVSVTVTAKSVKPTYIENVLIVNKTYGLPEDYNPYNGGLAPEVQEAFNKMAEDASKQGLNLYISSGYRTYAYQEQLYESYAQSDGYANADKYSARPGYSEHQTGLCFDLNSVNDSFADTAEGKWVAENCYKYGFIVRYPKGKESITGYQYEPWHLRYLGEFLATDVYNSGLCLEEFLGVTSQYVD